MAIKFRVVLVSIIFFIIILLVFSIGFSIIINTSGQSSRISKKKNLLDQIIANGQIRCAYITWPPMATKDPNTGVISGVFPEVIEKIALNAGLKIVWTGPVEYGTALEGLMAGRFDMLGTPLWANTNRALHAYFTPPLCFSAVEAFVRIDEKRIKSLDDLNQPGVIISTIEGEAAEAIARQDFPRARRTGLPQGADTSELYLELVTKKSDAILHDLVAATDFMVKNPSKIRRLAPGNPLRVYANCYAIPAGEEEFREFLNVAIHELLNQGFIEIILNKYRMTDITYPPARLYRAE